MTEWLISAGDLAVHTLDLPDGNRTTDQLIAEYADREQSVVVSKDADFVNSHLLHGKPAKLLLISVGNICNRDLEALFMPHLAEIVKEFQTPPLSNSDQTASPFVMSRLRDGWHWAGWPG